MLGQSLVTGDVSPKLQKVRVRVGVEAGEGPGKQVHMKNLLLRAPMREVPYFYLKTVYSKTYLRFILVEIYTKSPSTY